MIISRIINGVEYEFELNSQELYDAYIELEHEWDVSDVDARYGHVLSDEQVDAVAWEMRRQRDKYDLDFSTALDEAMFQLGLTDLEEAS